MANRGLWHHSFSTLFSVQLLGALNDNLFKSALLVILTLKGNSFGLPTEQMLLLVSGIFIAPFMIFSPFSGNLCDRIDKLFLTKAVKIFELILMTFAAVSLGLQFAYSNVILLILLFFMGLQSTIFGPVKYTLLSRMTHGDALLRANATFEGSTFSVILLGTLFGATFIESGQQFSLALSLWVFSALGLLASFFIKDTSKQPPADSSFGFIEQWRIVRHKPTVWAAILIVSWFWGLGSILLVEIPFIAQSLLPVPLVITGFLSVLVGGIVVGNVVIAHVAKARDEQTLIVWAFFAYIAMGVLLWIFSYGYSSLLEIQFSAQTWNTEHLALIALLVVLFLLAFSGGVFSVPVFTQLFRHDFANRQGSIIAQSNFWNALFIVTISLLVGLLLTFISLASVFAILGLVHFAFFPLLLKLYQGSWQSLLLRGVLRILYRLKIVNLKHYPKSNPKNNPKNNQGLLICSNYVSDIDPLILWAILPENVLFVQSELALQKPWMKRLFDKKASLNLDLSSKNSLKELVTLLQDGHHIVVFPEQTPSTTARLAKLYPLVAMACAESQCDILYCTIDGPQYTVFSHTPQGRKRLISPFSVTFSPVQKLNIPNGLSKNDARKFIIDEHEICQREAIFQASQTQEHLFTHLVRAAHRYGLNRKIIDDIQGKSLSYKRLLLGSLILGQKFADKAPLGAGVGLLLPNSGAVMASLFGLIAFDRIAVMLNYSSGLERLRSAIQTSTVQTVITSRRFIKLAELDDVIAGLSGEVEIVYLEDLRKEIRLTDKLRAFFALKFLTRRKQQRKSRNAAIILFTSGSEGLPKGVALSHENILSNIYQALSASDLNVSDRLLNPLPVFHCFGLTAGAMLPLFIGARNYQFPSPLRYQQISETVYHWKASVVFGTDSFLARYGEVAHHLDMQSLRFIVAGAEKLKEETVNFWQQKFGKTIYQGYGASEASPIISCNTPRFCQQGSVGLPFPGILCHLEPKQEIAEDAGVLWVKGPNVMMGYILANNPGSIIPNREGWHCTGDIVRITDEGFIRILGRQKRFAKIAGEMIALDRVEAYAVELWPQEQHAVLCREHAKRGEEIILYTTNNEATRDAFSRRLAECETTSLYCPKLIVTVDEIPLMATGKTDYVKLKATVEK